MLFINRFVWGALKCWFTGLHNEYDLICSTESCRELCYEGHCDVTVGQGEVFHLFFFPQTLAEWKFALSRSFPCKTPSPHPPALPMQRSVSHSHTHSHLPLSEKDRAVCQQVLWPFPKWRFCPVPKRLSCVHPSTHCLLRWTCSSSARFMRTNQTVFLFVKLKVDLKLTGEKKATLSQIMYIRSSEVE